MTDQPVNPLALQQQGSTALDVTTREGAMAMFQAYAEVAQEETETFAEIDIRKLIPTIGLSRDSETIIATIADQSLPQNGKRVIYLMLVDARAMRTLWAPEHLGDKFNRPVCSTGWVLPSDVKKNNTIGGFTVNEYVNYPYTVMDLVDGEEVAREMADGEVCNFNCANCPYNEFGSMAKYDPKREGSRAKACSESRTYFVIPVERGDRLPVEDEDLYFFRLSDTWVTNTNPFGIGLLTLSYGSNYKQIEQVNLQAAIRQIPLSALVFRIGNKHDTSGAYTIAQMVPELQGVVLQSDYFGKVRPHPTREDSADQFAMDWVRDFVQRYARTQAVEAAVEPGF